MAVVGTVVVGAFTGLAAGIETVGSHIGYSNGDRVGVVQKFSVKGLLCKSWEGQMAMPGFQSNGNNGGTSNLFTFSVNSGDSKIISELQQAERNPGQEYDLQYHQTLTNPFCSKKTAYTITQVTPVKGKTAGIG